MPQIDVTPGGPDFLIEEGIYPAHILGTEADELPQAKFKSGQDILRIYFQLDDMYEPDGVEKVRIDAIASRRLSPSTKLYGWVSNLGFKLDPLTVQTWNSDALDGMACRVVIGSNKKTDGSIWPIVTNVLAPSRGTGAVMAPKAPTSAYAGLELVASGQVNGGLPDLSRFWKQVDRLGISHEQALSRTTKPLEDYDEDQQLDLIELLRMEFLPAPPAQ